MFKLIEGGNCYCVYLGLKSHFYSKSYDYWKYSKKFNVKRATFESRNDKLFFYKIGRKFQDEKELETFFVANFKNQNKNITELLDDESMSNYYNHCRIMNDIEGVVRRDTKKIIERKNKNKKYISGGEIFKDVMAQEIFLETFCIFQIFFNIFDYYDKFLEDTLWKETSNFARKYSVYLSQKIDRPTLALLKSAYIKSFI